MSWPSLDRHKAELVARRDLRDATNEIRLILAMVTLTLAIPIASAVGIRALAYFGGGTAVVNRLAVVGAFFVVFIPASFSLVLAPEAFGGEHERTTLEVLLSTPLKEAEIYAGKVAAVLVVSLGLCYGGLIGSLVLLDLVLDVPPHGAEAGWRRRHRACTDGSRR